MVGFTIAKRLAIIQADIWVTKEQAGDIYELERLPEEDVVTQNTADRAVMQSLITKGHRLRPTARGHRCENCKLTRAASNFAFWDLNPCVPRPFACQILKRRCLTSTAVEQDVQPEKTPLRTNSAVAAQLHEVKPTSCLDNAELSDFAEEDDEDTLGHCALEAFEVDITSASVIGSPVGSLLKGKVIRGKTKPENTAYAHIRPLGSKLAAKSRKRKVHEVKTNIDKASKVARTNALVTMQGQIGSICEHINKQGFANGTDYNWGFADNIDPSHSLKAVGTEREAVFCERCGCWNAGGPLRLLKYPCAGSISQGRAYQHRLLTLGLIPRVGVKIPCHNRR
jgi:hypothetical protein